MGKKFRTESYVWRGYFVWKRKGLSGIREVNVWEKILGDPYIIIPFSIKPHTEEFEGDKEWEVLGVVQVTGQQVGKLYFLVLKRREVVKE